MREMAELDEVGGLGVPREGRLTRGVDLGEIVLGRAVLKGPAVTQGEDDPPGLSVAAVCWRRGTRSLGGHRSCVG